MPEERTILTVTSLVAIVLISVHVTDDIVRGMSGGGLENLVGILILVVWLYGTLVLRDHRSGLVVVLLGSLFAAAMPILHMRGVGVGGDFATYRQSPNQQFSLHAWKPIEKWVIKTSNQGRSR